MPDDKSRPFAIVGIGASAGGLEAFTQLLRALPGDTGMGFVLVQHLSPTHDSALTEILGRATRLPIMEVTDQPKVEPDHVYVIPPGRNMVIADGKLKLVPRDTNGVNKPIDLFLRALAEDQGHQAIGVILSGTATDGTLGCQEIKAAGGIVFAQDDTAQQDGMPKSAIATGCVDFVLPPAKIATELARIARHPYVAPAPAAAPPPREHDAGEPDLARILRLLHEAAGTDFALYKNTTVSRRIKRRMLLNEIETLKDYAGRLESDPAETRALYQDMLINVTSFFRDPEVFEALRTRVFPRLVKDRPRNEPLRAWILGCSTGEEAYSVAMSFAEFAESSGSRATMQIFATDLNATGIEKARAAVYPKEIESDVAPERLRRFFAQVDGHYRIAKPLRDMCVFAQHNALSSPPFSRMDLVTCRNLLIYLEPELQHRIIPVMHFALKPGGTLLLGTAETISSHRDLFEADDAKHKIFVRKPGPARLAMGLSRAAAPVHGERFPLVRDEVSGAEVQKAADRIVMAKYAPPGVVINSNMEIVQFRGDTSAYLAPAPGSASLSLLKMGREGLLVPLRAAVNKAKKQAAPVREPGVRVKSNGGYRKINLQVIPVNASSEPGFLLLFEEVEKKAARKPVRKATAATPEAEPGPDEIARLTQELAATREYLQSLIEQHEAANEELQSANEEAQSSNEELQSINEELETSKEEIQSSNEELATVNDELDHRNHDLGRLNNDLGNLIDSVRMPIVILGHDLRIRRMTPMAEKTLNLIPADLGRPIGDIRLAIDIPDLNALLTEAIDTVGVKEREVQDRNGRWYSLRIRPYKTLENKIDGAVIVLIDVDTLKLAREYAESIVATVREPLIVLDQDLRVKSASRSFYETFGVTREETENCLLYELGNRQWDIPDLRTLLEEVLPRGKNVEGFEVEHEFRRIGRKTMLLNTRKLATPEGNLILLAIEDITERKRGEDALRQNHVQLQSHADELTRFNRAAVGREVRMIELKKEVNELCRQYGEAARHPLEFEQEGKETDA